MTIAWAKSFYLLDGYEFNQLPIYSQTLQQSYCKDFSMIVKNYLKGTFFLDLISVLPILTAKTFYDSH